MTCIAWDGKTLAGDKKATFAGRPVITTKVYKVKFKTKTYLIGFSGSEGPGLKFIEHFKRKGFNDYPEVSGVNIIIISKKAVWMIDSDGYKVDMNERVWTLGSGGDIALGAIVTGATAEQAVEIACQYDSGCGMGVDVVKF